MKTKQKTLSQFFTPAWAAEILFQAHFSHLTEKDLVWEPSCGPGACLSAIPQHIPAVGNDIDPTLARQAQENTGRLVYSGDFRTITFDRINKVTAIFGNPPFSCDLFEEFMKRCENILKTGNKAGFILPAYFFQTSRTLLRFARRWDIYQEMIPRDLFKGSGVLSKPLIFASFIREDFPKVFGFRLYQELSDVGLLNKEVQDVISNTIKRTGSVWREALIKVVRDSGGTVTLDEAYRNMEGKRPTQNPFWKEQVRKIIQQQPFQRIDNAKYQLVI